MNILKIIKEEKKYLILIIIFSIFQILTELLLPNIMSNIVDIGIVKNNTSYIIKYTIIMILLGIISLSSAIVVLYYSSRFASIFSYRLREKLYTKINKLSKADIDHFGASTLITRSTNDINHVSEICSFGARIIVIAPIMGIGSITMALFTEISLAWIILVAVILLCISILIIFFGVYKKFELLQKLLDNLNEKSREILNGLKVIKAFNKQSYFKSKFNKTNNEYKILSIFINKLFILTEPIVLIIINFASVAVLYFSSIGINNGTIEVGSMMAFIQYLNMILISFTMILMIIVMIPRTLVSFRRIEEIYKKDITVKDNGKLNLKDINTIEFKNVSFRYNKAKEDTISNISFKLNKNNTYGIIGSSGSGKSTIINLLLRLIEPTNGTILINNKDIKLYTLESLRNTISYSPQRPVIFKGSVKDNLIFDKNIKEEKIYDKLESANIKELIINKKEKLNYELESNIVNLSGGEKARLNITRSLLKESSMYVFDDSFSSIDYITDAKIRDNLNNLNNVIKLFITQRIGTVKNVDEIILLENGELDSIGKFNELKKRSKIFNEFLASQEAGEDYE